MIKSKEQSEIVGAEIYRCYHCGGVLGVTTHGTLYAGVLKFHKHVTFDCALCDKTTFWKPDNEKTTRQ